MVKIRNAAKMIGNTKDRIKSMLLFLLQYDQTTMDKG